MCLVCSHHIQFFAGVPTGRAPQGTIAFNTAANYAAYVFDGGWQAIGSNFGGGATSHGGATTADYQAVLFFPGPPTGVAVQGAIGFNTAAIPYVMYVFAGGWKQVGVGSGAAPDILTACGPNVLFSPTNPPAAPAACLPNGTLVLPVVAGAHAGYVSKNCVLEPFG